MSLLWRGGQIFRWDGCENMFKKLMGNLSKNQETAKSLRNTKRKGKIGNQKSQNHQPRSTRIQTLQKPSKTLAASCIPLPPLSPISFPDPRTWSKTPTNTRKKNLTRGTLQKPSKTLAASCIPLPPPSPISFPDPRTWSKPPTNTRKKNLTKGNPTTTFQNPSGKLYSSTSPPPKFLFQTLELDPKPLETHEKENLTKGNPRLG